LERAKSVANEHAQEVLETIGVVGIGAGLTEGGKPAVVLLLEQSRTDVPATLGGFPVVTVVTGKITALAPPPLDAEFTWNCSGLTCDFDASATSGRGKKSYEWDFDASDGIQIEASGENFSHTYPGVGTYTVTLTASNSSGETDAQAHDVTVSDGGGGPPPPEGDVDCYTTGDTTARCARPVPIGVSTGHPDITAGTIGARVTDGTNVYALSNNHVYANENLASLDDNVLQPGSYDGGVNPDDEIGTLHRFEPIIFNNTGTCNLITGDECNVIDAAIALSSTTDLGNSTIDAGYGTPSSIIADASARQKVQKCGRTTGCTRGRIYGTGFTVDVGYDSGTARFIDQIVIIGGGFSDGGDSGSLVVTQSGEKNPVGLLFAGSSNSTIINPIGTVLSRFGVWVDGN
jgi:PKD repeat protein